MTTHRTADYLDHMLDAAQQACRLLKQLPAIRNAARAADNNSSCDSGG